MKFENLLKKARKTAEKVDISEVDFLAVQINVTDPDGGVFYVEVKDHRVSVEPYEYYDRHCSITLSNADCVKFLNGKLDGVKAYDEGVIQADGDLGKAAWFCDLIKKAN